MGEDECPAFCNMQDSHFEIDLWIRNQLQYMDIRDSSSGCLELARVVAHTLQFAGGGLVGSPWVLNYIWQLECGDWHDIFCCFWRHCNRYEMFVAQSWSDKEAPNVFYVLTKKMDSHS
jgi:hypothetical protein